jgi:hypothetical protein
MLHIIAFTETKDRDRRLKSIPSFPNHFAPSRVDGKVYVICLAMGKEANRLWFRNIVIPWLWVMKF